MLRKDTGMNYLEMNHIKKAFGDLEVLKDISIKVPKGQVLAIIGPSVPENPPSALCHTA